MIFAVIGLVLLAIGLAVFALAPTFRQQGSLSSAQTERLELEEERDTLYQSIRELERDHTAGLVDAEDYRRLRLRDETRAALILEKLEDLPPVPTQATASTRPAWVTAATLLAIFAVGGVLAGAFAAWPLQRLSLRVEEKRSYDAAKLIPALEAKVNQEASTDPNKLASVDTLLEYGQTAWEMQDYERAAKAYSDILRRDKGNPVALMRVGTLLFFSGDNQRGLEFLNGAIKLAPNDPKIADAYLNKGNLLFSSNDPKGALEAFEKYKTLAGKEASNRVGDLIAAAKTRLLESDPGAKLFARSCAGCHGAEAQGLVGPNLKTSQKAKDASFVTRQLQRGSPNGKMPAQNVTPEELKTIVKYVTGLK